jgi:hypothetical protein
MSFLRTKLNSRTPLSLIICGLAASLLISSTGCGFAGSGGPPNIAPEEPNVVSLDPANWYILYSAGMPPHPAADPEGVWSFDFPKSENGGYLGYVETPFNATTTLHNVTIVFRVDNNAAQYVVHDPTDHLPATFRLMIEQQNDDLSNLNGRWWAQASMYDLGSQDNQILTISVPLTSDQWTNVHGEHDAQAFAQALENVGWVGLTFGGQFFAGHGAAISSGSAKFVLIDYSIN